MSNLNKLYYNSGCRGCQKMVKFLKKYSMTPYDYGAIQDSKFSSLTQETIVLEFDTGEYFTHGKALGIILAGCRYPLNFLSFLPESILDQVYSALKHLRRFL